MAQQASDVRAGGAYYEMSVKDAVAPALEKIRARVAAARSIFTSTFDSGAGGTGLVNRFLFGRKEFDALTQKYLGRVGGLVGALRRARDAASALGSSLRNVGAGLSLGGAVASAPILALLKGGFDRNVELANLSRQLGVPIEALNKLQYAAERAGVSLDEVMQDTSGRYSDLIAQAPPINTDDVRAAAELQRELADSTRALQDALVPLLSSLAPYVKLVGAWAKENAHILGPLAVITAGVAALGAVLGAAGASLAGIVAGGAAIVGMWKAILVALGVAAQVVAVGGAIAGVGYAFLTMTESGRRLAGVLKGDLASGLSTARVAWGGFAAALKKGDLEGAFEVASASMGLAWAGTILRMEKAWAGFKGFFVDGWHEITSGLGEPLREFVQFHIEAFEKIWGALKEIGAKISERWNAVWSHLREPVLKVLEFLAPLGAIIAAPFVAVAALVREAWDGMGWNIRENVVKLSAWLQKNFWMLAEYLAGIFGGVTTSIIDSIIKVAKAADALDPTGAIKKGIDAAEKFRAEIGTFEQKARDEKDGVEERKQGALKGLQDERAEDKRQRQAARDADVEAANKGVTDAGQRLKDVLLEAGKERKPTIETQLAPIRQELLGMTTVKGGFSSSALNQQFGYGNQVNKTNELMKQLVDGQKLLPAEIAQELAPLVGVPPIR